MQLTIYHPGTSAVWADALFASVLQRSDNPSAGQVRKAVAAAVRAYGGLGCVQRVAQEFGDHPEAAVDRMRWARAVSRRVVRLTAGACAAEPAKTAGTARGQPAEMAAGRVMKRIRAGKPRIRRERAWTEDPPADLRDPDVVRAKALARARPAARPGPARLSRRTPLALARTPEARGAGPVHRRASGPVKVPLSGGRRPPSLSRAS